MAAAGGTAGLSRAQERLVAAQGKLQEAEDSDTVDELRIARAELGVAKAELGVAKAELKAAPAEEKANAELGVAKAELGVAKAELKAAPQEEQAKAEVGVAEAKVGVAEAKWQAAREGEERENLWTLVQSAQAAVEALRAAAPPHGAFAGGEGDRGGADVLRAVEDVNRALREGFEATQAVVLDSNIEKVSMSNATREFTTALLEGLDVKWVQIASNTEKGKNFSFSWEGGEEHCTRRAIDKMRSIIGKFSVLGENMQVDFRDVQSRNLHTLRACGKESTGQTDVAITLKELQHSDLAKFNFVIGIVELKTDKA